MLNRAHVGLLASAVVGAALLFPSTAMAQGHQIEIDGYTPFTFVLLDKLPYSGAHVVIVRRAAREPHDVIVVRNDGLTKKRLSEAAFVLMALRSRHGNTPSADMTYRIRDNSAKRRTDEMAENWVRSLKMARARDVDGFGTVPSVTIAMPNQRSRGAP